MSQKAAVITGITGQDGSYLAELLLEKGYSVHGIVRDSTWNAGDSRLANIHKIRDKIHIHVGSIGNPLFVFKVIESVRPVECYHLASSSFVSYSLDDELGVLSQDFNGTHALLAAIRSTTPECKFYFAGSSEMFGIANAPFQDESTAFNPRSIYGIAKLAAFHLARNYREKHEIFTSTGILYNHESSRRGFEFVTRKITSTVAKIKLGIEKKLSLGNLDAQRDWGYAPDYVKAMWLMLQQNTPEDYVIATGKLHTVRYFVERAFAVVGLNYEKFVEVDERFYRPSEKTPLVGNSEKARQKLGWNSDRSLDFVIEEMVLSDLELLKA